MAALGSNRLKVLIDGEERNAEVSSLKITTEDSDSDFVSFADAAAGGGKTWKLAGTAVQDPGDADSVWSLIWGAAGTEVAVSVNPYGSVAAAPTTPWFTGTCTVKADGDILGGEADASPTQRFVIEFEWEFTAKPTKVVA